MGNGNLIINVYADNTGQPVEGAVVTISGGAVMEKLTTNSSGQTKSIPLNCPDKSLSLNPQRDKIPYALYTVNVKKGILREVTVMGVQILDGTLSMQDILMQSEPEKDAPAETISIPPHVLWGDYPPKIVVDPESQIPGAAVGDVLAFPIVPEYVIVHDALPTNTTAAQYFIPFSEYIKNVASSEIYSTWPRESLKANIYAILSFTMSRIYSEWYLSRGMRFTITSSTQFDQKFVYGRNIYAEIANVVDEIFDQFIAQGSRTFPFFAQYNDGIRVSNPGWLSQWGSKDLADRGYTALNILKYYYGDNISLKTATVIEGVPNSFPGNNLRLGICGENVQKMQTELNVISSSYPAIPKINPADGNYAPSTEAAVRVFQQVFSMPVTGVVDFATWFRISYLYIGVSKMLQGRY